MNETYSFGGQELTLSPRVKHKVVRRVQNVMTEWMLGKINLETMIGNGNVDESSMTEMLQQIMRDDPKMVLEIQDMESSMLLDQTIMLASGIEYSLLKTLKDDAYEEDYIKLYQKCYDILGGTADNFFLVYHTGSVPQRKRKQIPNNPSLPDTSPE